MSFINRFFYEKILKGSTKQYHQIKYCHNILLVNVLNKIGDKGHLWRTPRCIGNSFENLPLKFVQTFEVR